MTRVPPTIRIMEFVPDNKGPYVIIGPFPPPHGGISNYVYRLYSLLKDRGEKVRCLDLTELTILRKLLYAFFIIFYPIPIVLHVHVINPRLLSTVVLRPFPKHIIYHDHSGRFVDQLTSRERRAVQRFLNRCDDIIFVNSHLADYYRRAGLSVPEDRVKIISSFLPPPLSDRSKVVRSYSRDTMAFVERSRPLIIANGSALRFHGGVDLYGMDMCVELIKQLREEFPTIGLMFALGEIGDYDYFNGIQYSIRNEGIGDNFYIMLDNTELWPLFENADLMVRPTCVDAYGISIAEALYFDCPAIASDVCERPEGTVLFSNRDQSDFLQKCRNTLVNTRLSKREPSTRQFER